MEKVLFPDYFLDFSGSFADVLEEEAFASALTGFIGCSQQTSSHPSSHSHGFSINTTRPPLN